MLFLNEKDKALNVFFVAERHLDMLKSLKIPFSALPYLLFYPVSKEDLKDWIEYQRSVELKYFGRKFTTYSKVGSLKLGQDKPYHDLSLFEAELVNIYNSTKYYDESSFSMVHCGDDTILILSKEKNVLENNFKMVDPFLPKAIYQTALNILGYHQLHFRDPVRNKDALGVGLAELVSVITK